jgi:signal transduction histidine kinase
MQEGTLPRLFCSHLQSQILGMTDTIVLRLLWAIAISGTAALVATISTRLATLPWWFHFGFNLLALSVVSYLARWLSRRIVAKPMAATLSDSPREGELDMAFLSEASHEMKTPLAGIKAYVELLADGAHYDEVVRVEFLDGIVSQVDRLEHAVEKILAKPLRGNP